ncbi:DUF2891 family protein [Nostoc sp. CHAB 5715]
MCVSDRSSNRQHGLADIVSEHYAASHWVGTFAVYLLTNRGLQGQIT